MPQKVYEGGVLAVLLCGCESQCLSAESVRRLSNWHNKRIREMFCVTMFPTFVHQTNSESLQKRTEVFSLERYLASRTQRTWRACPKTASPIASCSPGYESPVSPAAKRLPMAGRFSAT